jgi:transcriptional regulator with XRE-family HTH domain
MVPIGPTTTASVEQLAGNLLRVARSRQGMTQRQLAAAVQMPQSTVARIEAGSMQPTLPVLYRLLAAAGLEPRVRLEPYDDHDDVLDRLAERFPQRQAEAERARDETLAFLTKAQ